MSQTENKDLKPKVQDRGYIRWRSGYWKNTCESKYLAASAVARSCGVDCKSTAALGCPEFSVMNQSARSHEGCTVPRETS